ncbi:MULTISPECIES: hybrid sensor histidine kinase/response regulator [unclassified Pseudomonas]|uniref:hybrid sensor histidine kinase/response regulator n=1 Tax=unclassified Pseudomonas TaxID=196821 RepID=UPI00087690ED|nr:MULTISPECIES: hybrid sensor histidine kinase/response regulator [unclassified Pseudomonas]SCZ18682.1 Signal transduction histidine kinase [Pseudomonas sp. NFACC44-2]SDA81336.1 Signal transduction histidine kinase [Pseudomonas sp. NFACC51]SEI40323.1 Signal transduction histidine kinase [Pseudomonas sp. NFACC07-1]SFG99099.1 Signal transduction histidine kinase [Pseudomonas sp. NFACC54]SFL67954.1 Signal transduction histidine kinase [Pseudomonas sp. NFACC46-3]
MAKPSDEQQKALAGLLGLGNHSTRKSHYPELAARLDELEQARQHLQQLNDQLEQRVAERTDALLEANHNLQQQIVQRELIEQQLRDARDAAQAANRSKDKYLAAASHDLLQPLNAARLLIATLRERQLPTAEHVLVERTHQALEGAEDLLTDLLDISRLDQAAVKPDLAPYRLDELLGPLVSEFQSVAGAAGLELRVRFGDEAVLTDLRLISRILRNLLSNACRYTTQGGILLAARRRGGRLSIEVWDTGRGIAADCLESIFLEFNQLDVGRAADRKGVGLGLAIVERIAHILGYRVKVRSRPGRGSVFSIEVPLSSEKPLPVSQVPVQAVAGNPLPGRRLLVIDNELSILQSMAALLGQWGCEVLTATDEAGALDVLQGRVPELILADFHLDHGVVGCEVVKHLREHFHQAIPAVIITADRSDQCRRALRKLGAPLLNKPLKPGKLRAVLSQMLG